MLFASFSRAKMTRMQLLLFVSKLFAFISCLYKIKTYLTLYSLIIFLAIFSRDSIMAPFPNIPICV